MPNQEQVDFWNGPRGAQWAAGQEILDRQLRPFGDTAIQAAHLMAGERVVDVGCGCGDTTLALAQAVGPRGSVLGVDVSQPMLARARERVASTAQIRLACGDASTFEFDGRADCVFSRFGVMFFDDPTPAFVNLRKALAPGGRLAFACWRPITENDWMAIPLGAVSAIIAPRPPLAPDAPGPFAFADPARVRKILEGSGFHAIEIAPVDVEVQLGDGDLASAVTEAVSLGPAARLLMDADDETRARAEVAVRAALAPHVREGAVHLRAASWVVTAKS